MDRPAVALGQGLATGKYLAGLGVNLDLAPVLDVPSSAGSVIGQQGRAFSSSPAAVSALGTAFAQGLADGGVAATAKHFPGLGQADADTDLGRSVVSGFMNSDLTPFRAAIAGGVPAVMTSTAIYPRYDRRNPAAWSPAIVGDLLRRQLGFKGVVITDDLASPGVRSMTSTAEAAVASAKAGGDIALIASDPSEVEPTYRELFNAARSGSLPFHDLLASYRRITRLKGGFK
jgi:beta-N-acetylhexosaminidase